MSGEVVLAAGRTAAQRGFTDRCTITRAEGDPITNRTDGTTSQTQRLLYDGPCRFQQAAAPWAGPATVGQAGIGLSALEVQLPIAGTQDVTKDDTVTCTTATNDAGLLSRRFTVQGAHHATSKTTRRLPLQEILG